MISWRRVNETLGDYTVESITADYPKESVVADNIIREEFTVGLQYAPDPFVTFGVPTSPAVATQTAKAYLIKSFMQLFHR